MKTIKHKPTNTRVIKYLKNYPIRTQQSRIEGARMRALVGLTVSIMWIGIIVLMSRAV